MKLWLTSGSSHGGEKVITKMRETEYIPIPSDSEQTLAGFSFYVLMVKLQARSLSIHYSRAN